MRSLWDAGPGYQGDIAEVRSHDERGIRLLELGFVPGASIRVLSRLPMSGGVVVDVEGGRFALRISEAELIFVRDASPC